MTDDPLSGKVAPSPAGIRAADGDAGGVRFTAIASDLANTLQTPAAVMLRGRDPAGVPQQVPLARFGDGADYADVVPFLASDHSRYVTGHTILVDGGTPAASGWFRRADGPGWTSLPTAP